MTEDLCPEPTCSHPTCSEQQRLVIEVARLRAEVERLRSCLHCGDLVHVSTGSTYCDEPTAGPGTHEAEVAA